MSGEIVNRVAKSSLITMDLTDYAPTKPIAVLDLKDFLFQGIVLKEKNTNGGIQLAFLNSNVTLIGQIVTSATATSYQTSSDYRLKEDLKEFDQINHKDLPNYSLSNKYDVIGYDWKEYNFQSQSYEILDDNTYLIKTQEGNYFKLRFTSFLNEQGERGFPAFEFSEF